MSATAPYGRIDRSLWTDPSFRGLPAEARLVYLYMVTGPHSHMSGLSPLPLAMIADDLRLDLEAVRAALSGPLAGLVDYDEDTRELFVVAAGRMQIGPELVVKGKNGQPDNRWIGVRRHIEGIHSARLRERFLAVYGEPWNLLDEDPSEDPSQALPKTLRSHSSSSNKAKSKSNNSRSTGSPSEGDSGPAGHSTRTAKRQPRSSGSDEFDADRIARTAKALSKPGRADANRAWIEADPETRAPIAEGLLHLRDTGEEFERGELFYSLEKLFDAQPELAARCEGAWWKMQDADTPRAARLEAI